MMKPEDVPTRTDSDQTATDRSLSAESCTSAVHEKGWRAMKRGDRK